MSAGLHWKLLSERKKTTENVLNQKAAVIVGIDFGTTYSEYAFMFTSMGDERRPTCVLLTPDKTFNAFELEPEEHQSHYFFHHFKMKLYESKKLTRETFIRDQTGKDMKAVDVYSIVLQYFNRAAMQQVGQVKNDQPVQGFSSKHILWMLSMPAIWTDYARQFMREAATNAELENVKLVLESEAGDVFAIDKQLNMRQDMFAGKFPVGHKYILADLGGGTVDICVHEVVEGRNLCELYRATGDCAEGSRVNHAFEQFFVRFVWGSSTRKFQKEMYSFVSEIYPEY
ncbi:HS12B-like protein [Mya arenaria]|uniref:HS12B-like protein n=1 Tax=Mya arenaria TaxID=6604 RepID=A0ABY7F763_MYAAR|nr:HS12B-like protein [Mya arenaria]